MYVLSDMYYCTFKFAVGKNLVPAFDEVSRDHLFNNLKSSERIFCCEKGLRKVLNRPFPHSCEQARAPT